MTKKNMYDTSRYTTWRNRLDPVAEKLLRDSARPKNTIVKASIIAIGVALMISVVSQLIAMSQFSTLGYEIEVLQDRRADLIETNTKLKSAIADYQTTEYYKKQATALDMRMPEKITFIHISGQDIAETGSEWQTPQN